MTEAKPANWETSEPRRLPPLPPLIAPLCILAVAVLCVTFNGGISIGASNHVGLLPVVRRLLDPNFLPDDFNISLRLYHHRVFAYLIAGLTKLFGEARGLIVLHCVGATFFSTALWYLCRTLKLGWLSFLTLGSMLATGFLWTGRGLEENDFLGNPEIQPPLFAHACALLATALLMQSRYRWAAVCAGLTVFFHLQIGVIFTLMIAPLYAVRLRDFGWREVLRLAACYLLPALPAFSHLLLMLQRGLLKPAVSHYSLAYYIDFRHPHHFALMSAQHALWVGGHILLLLGLWLWLRRQAHPATRSAFVLLALSLALSVLALAHFADYYWLRQDKFANLQSIRLSPMLTVFGALGLLLWLKLGLGETPAAPRWAWPVALTLLLAATAGWGRYVATRVEPEPDFFFGVRYYDDPSSLTGQRKQWVKMCNWIKANTPADAVFLTPPANEGFTVLTNRSNVVEFKINPDGALQMDEWFARLKDLTGDQLPTARGLDNRRPLNKAYGELNAEQLAALGRKYHAQFAVLPKAAQLPFPVLYETEALKLVELPRAAAANNAL